MQRVFTLIGHLVMKLLATRLRTLLQLTAFMMALLALIPLFTFPDLFSLSPSPLTCPVSSVNTIYNMYVQNVHVTWIDNICISRANCVYLRNIGSVYTFETKVISQKLPESYNLEQLEMIKPSKPNKLIVAGAASSLLAVVALQ